ncbi:hypothetical protein AB4232_19370 [Vibrio sp. 10N.286.46.A8]|uniref:hypothetical protein n=1 Tax=Vibrio sp. 10N.286.46.A8 TaxID=3229697 RepID=UPI00354CBC78
MKVFKIFTMLNAALVSGAFLLSYINGLGCAFTLHHWTPNLPYEIYSTCTGGVLNMRISAKPPYNGTIGEFSGRYLTLNGHNVVLISEIYNLELNEVRQFPFKANLERNKYVFSHIKRFDERWVGIFSDYPANVAFLAEVEGYLSLEDRVK